MNYWCTRPQLSSDHYGAGHTSKLWLWSVHKYWQVCGTVFISFNESSSFVRATVFSDVLKQVLRWKVIDNSTVGKRGRCRNSSVTDRKRMRHCSLSICKLFAGKTFLWGYHKYDVDSFWTAAVSTLKIPWHAVIVVNYQILSVWNLKWIMWPVIWTWPVAGNHYSVLNLLITADLFRVKQLRNARWLASVLKSLISAFMWEHVYESIVYKSCPAHRWVGVALPTAYCSESEWCCFWKCNEAERTCYFQFWAVPKTWYWFTLWTWGSFFYRWKLSQTWRVWLQW